jgi:hypothetical protein
MARLLKVDAIGTTGATQGFAAPVVCVEESPEDSSSSTLVS